VAVAVAVGVPVAVAVGDAVGVPVAVAVGLTLADALGVAVADTAGVTDADADGDATAVGDVLGAMLETDVAGAEAMGEETECTPAVWGVQPATATPLAAEAARMVTTTDAMASGRRCLRRPERPGRPGAGCEPGDSRADVTVRGPPWSAASEVTVRGPAANVRSRAAGRRPGSLARQRSMSPRTSAGTPSRFT
jgi:hypothetical protein